MNTTRPMQVFMTEHVVVERSSVEVFPNRGAAPAWFRSATSEKVIAHVSA